MANRLGYLKTQSHFNPKEGSWVPNDHGQDWSGFATMVSGGQGAPWVGLVCAPEASWTKWDGMGSVTVFPTIEDAIAEAVRLGGTEDAARVAYILCE